MEKNTERKNTLGVRSLMRSFSSVMGSEPIIEIESNRRVNLEGSRGVIHYSDSVIKISLTGFVAVFEGRKLRLRSITPTALVLEGFFTSIRFEI